MRFVAFVVLVALMGATLLAGSLTAAMRPLIAAVERLEAPQP